MSSLELFQRRAHTGTSYSCWDIQQRSELMKLSTAPDRPISTGLFWSGVCPLHTEALPAQSRTESRPKHIDFLHTALKEGPPFWKYSWAIPATSLRMAGKWTDSSGKEPVSVLEGLPIRLLEHPSVRLLCVDGWIRRCSATASCPTSRRPDRYPVISAV